MSDRENFDPIGMHAIPDEVRPHYHELAALADTAASPGKVRKALAGGAQTLRHALGSERIELSNVSADRREVG